MKKNVLIILFMIVSIPILAQQKQGNIWHFGRRAGLDFNTTPPTPLLGASLDTREGCTSIADDDGKLLFYTDGIRIWDATHAQMPNGFGMTGHPSSTQSGVIVPKPADPNIYYVFTVGARIGRLDYSVVDMRLNGGLGDVVTKNIPLLASSTEKISAALHQNKRDIWVLGHEWNNDKFYAWLVTDQGVSTTPVVTSAGSVHSGGGDEAIGYLKFASNTKKVAVAGFGQLDFVEVFDFDNAAGTLTFGSRYTGFGAFGPYGLEFSPDSKYLYISERFLTTSLYQVEVGTPSGPISSSSVRLITDSNFGALQLATDGKVYLAREDSGYLGVIHNPDEAGLAANFELNGIHLGGASSRLGLPTFIQSFFKRSFTASALCVGDTTPFTIEPDLLTGIDSVVWDFGDPATGGANISRDLSPTHVFSSTGDFTVSLTTYFNTVAVNDNKVISIQPLPDLNLGADTILLQSETLDMSLPNSLHYSWLDNDTRPNRQITDPGWYWTVATDANSCSIIDSVAVFRLTYNYTCPLDNTRFSLAAGNVDVDSVRWNFGDPQSGPDNNSVLLGPGHTYNEPGNFTVSLNIYYDGQRTDRSFPVAIKPLPDAGLPEAISTVNGRAEALTISSLDVSWDDNSTNTLRRFDTPGWHWADVTNADLCTARDSLAVFNIIYADSCHTSQTHFELEAGNVKVDSVSWDFDDPASGAANSRLGTITAHEFSTPGDYDVTANIFFNNHVLVRSFPLTVIPLPEFDLGPERTLFYGETERLSVTGRGAEYRWQDGSGEDNFLVEAPGVYWVEVTTEVGCTARDSVRINYDQVINVALPADTLLCPDQTLPIDVSIPDATYKWQDGSANSTFVVNSPGIYWVEITNAFQTRTLTDTIRVDYYAFNDIEIAAERVICFEQSIELAALGAKERETYRWYNENMELLAENSGTYITPDLSRDTNYFVTLTNGTCESDPVSISVIYDEVIAEIVPSDTIVRKGDPVQLDGYGGEFYSWSPPKWLDRTDQPTVIANPEGNLKYTLTVSSAWGCTDTDSVQIYVKTAIYVPNAFSPNGDGQNDTWTIINLERFPDNTVQIYNRWGTLVYAYHRYQDHWDGTKNGTQLPGGTYTYVIHLGDLNNTVMKGTVKIIR